MMRRYQVGILGQATRQIPPESLIVPVLLDDANDMPNSVVRESHGGAGRLAVQFYRSFCGKSRQSRGVRSGDNFQWSLFDGHDRVTTNVGLGGRLLAGLGYWLGLGPSWLLRVGYSGTSCGVPPCTVGAQINCSGGALSESFSGTTASLASEE